MKLGFIGTGNMGGAILKGSINSNYMNPDDIYAYDIDSKKLDMIVSETNIHKCDSIENLIQSVDMVLMAIKPYFIDDVVKENYHCFENKPLLSIALGYDFEKYKTILPESCRHLFVMPNTPCLVEAGMCLIEEVHSFNDEEYQFAKGLFDSFASTVVLPSRLMKIGGAISGCGPAFIYMMIEAFGDAGVKHGLPRDLAYEIASTMIMGSGKMQVETKLHPGVLKDQVCSPAGATIRGVEALEKENFRATVMEAINQAVKI